MQTNATNPKVLVEAGYDQMAGAYLASKDPADGVVLEELEALAEELPERARVLELGCGAGVPATKWLARRFDVTGVDISERQLELAREHIPNATFLKADMGVVNFPPESFDAVVSLYAIIHLPREEQPALLSRIHSWLTSGGVFLANWAVSNWEGSEENWEGWGAPMWWSHYGSETNLEMLREAGFEIASAQVKTSNGETWLWVRARKA